MRAWSAAFWRPRPADDPEGAPAEADRTGPAGEPASEAAVQVRVRTARAPSRLLGFATGALVVAGLALTVFAGPLFDLAERAGAALESSSYVGAVLGEDADG